MKGDWAPGTQDKVMEGEGEKGGLSMPRSLWVMGQESSSIRKGA